MSNIIFNSAVATSENHSHELTVPFQHIPIELHILTFTNRLILLPTELLNYILTFILPCKIKKA